MSIKDTSFFWCVNVNLCLSARIFLVSGEIPGHPALQIWEPAVHPAVAAVTPTPRVQGMNEKTRIASTSAAPPFPFLPTSCRGLATNHLRSGHQCSLELAPKTQLERCKRPTQTAPTFTCIGTFSHCMSQRTFVKLKPDFFHCRRVPNWKTKVLERHESKCRNPQQCACNVHSFSEVPLLWPERPDCVRGATRLKTVHRLWSCYFLFIVLFRSLYLFPASTLDPTPI